MDTRGVRMLKKFSDNGSLWNLGALGFSGGVTTHLLGGPAGLRNWMLWAGAGFLLVDLVVSLFITEEQ